MLCFLSFIDLLLPPVMASSHQEDGGIFFFALGRDLMWRTLVGGRLYGGNVVFGLRGGHLRLSSLHPPIGKSACR